MDTSIGSSLRSYETGLRKGQAAALQWTDIYLKATTMTITKTLDFTAKNKDELLGDPKTDHSRRTITKNTRIKTNWPWQNWTFKI